MRSTSQCRWIYSGRRDQLGRGFTLIEILTVIGIVLVLAAILFPVFARARRAAFQASTLSNLRQCATALAVYRQDYGDTNILPPKSVVDVVVGHDISCDPSDYWRSSCSQEWGAPMVGSFGYLGALNTGLRTPRSNNPVLFIDIFYSTPKIEPFRGDSPPSPFTGSMDLSKNYLMPEKVIVSRMDLSASVENPQRFVPHGTWIHWVSMFSYLSWKGQER